MRFSKNDGVFFRVFASVENVELERFDTENFQEVVSALKDYLYKSKGDNVKVLVAKRRKEV